MTSGGMNAPASSSSRIGLMLTSPSSSSKGSAASTTTPVTILDPSGTTTRAPTVGAVIPSGTRYVSRFSAGTGTATWMNNGESKKVTFSFYLLPFAFYLQKFPHPFHVLPYLALRGRVPQQIGGVEGGNEL